MSKVFLGGTCNESTWRDELIAKLHIDYFNPVVPDWTPECQVEEIRQREACDFCLYTITPRMTGVYAIAEVVDDSNKRPERAVFCVLAQDGELAFTPGQLRSLKAVAAMVERNGGKAFTSLEECAKYLNGGGGNNIRYVESPEVAGLGCGGSGKISRQVRGMLRDLFMLIVFLCGFIAAALLDKYVF